MFSRLGEIVTHRWAWVIAGWFLLACFLRIAAPPWDSVALDGDFEFLPSHSASVRGERLLDDAFPRRHSKSQIVVVVARDTGKADRYDLFVAYELARRLHNLAGAAILANVFRLDEEIRALEEGRERAETSRTDRDRLAELRSRRDESLHRAEVELNKAVELTRQMFDALDALERDGIEGARIDDRQLAFAYHNRARLNHRLENMEAADEDDFVAQRLCEDRPLDPNELYPVEADRFSISEVWTWQSEGVGSKLIRLRGQLAVARLLILHLPTEFLAFENIELFDTIQSEVESVRQWSTTIEARDLQIEVTGSAAVGSDLLLASAESVRHTEIVTILLVTLILVIVYRSPLMIGLPLITIGVSLSVALCTLALLTQVSSLPGMAWFDFEVYKTTRIFVVVILFGAGTDYCLFLVSRYREELSSGLAPKDAVPRTVAKVGEALAASAFTTMVGLAMMYFAEFGKLRNSGPAIAVCLGITLVSCMSLAPALLRCFGRFAFWPSQPGSRRSDVTEGSHSEGDADDHAEQRTLWGWVARAVAARPGIILIVSYAVVAPLAYAGFMVKDHVSYDMLSSLDRDRPSRKGADLLRRHFAIGENGPVTVLAQHPDRGFIGNDDEVDYELIARIDTLAEAITEVEGVAYVRSLAAPSGNSGDGGSSVVNMSLRALPLVRSIYVTNEPQYAHRVTRLEVILEYDAFSLEATQTVDRIERLIETPAIQQDEYWSETDFAFAGTSAGIRDLRSVTRSDTRRIQLLVVIAVFVVLLVILKRPVICLYMILTVVLSFLVTLALTDWFFSAVEGSAYRGLEWRVPLFLFVILVAVGEDYNVYLASRIFEEQKRVGMQRGLTIAVSKTGGIISSCGLIMAGTFVSMTSGTWGAVIPFEIPWQNGEALGASGSLKGLVQMGFALSLGVLIDTFFVRPILLPAFIALSDRLAPHRQR